jgi:hypothetical protein
LKWTAVHSFVGRLAVALLVLHPLFVSVKPTRSVSELAGWSPCFTLSIQFTIFGRRDCNKCAETKCVAIAGSPTSAKEGISKGALAGGVVGAILFFALAVALFLHYRKKVLHKTSGAQENVKDTPAPAEMVLNRPDPMGNHPSELGILNKAHLAPTNNTVDLGSDAHLPYMQPSAGHDPVNPFDDTNSIQTAGTEGTNVIPIALVSRDSHHPSVTHSDASRPSTSSLPVRPVRTPDINLNLDHLNVSHDNIRFGAGSTRSGVSGISRNSYMSSASYASEFLNEAPMIMTPTQGAIRQVLGVVKAEVINTAASSDTLKPFPYSKPAVTSPLATNSFAADQTIKEDDERVNDPFADENTSKRASHKVSTAPSAATFGHGSQTVQQSTQDQEASLPSSFKINKANDHARPSSTYTQAGSVIDIASATRVNLGLRSPGSSGSLRTTMGRLISPTTAVGYQQPLVQAQRQPHAHDLLRRVSGSSVLSATSTHADSILESFPFVPPSPISDRPVRSPPVSPLAKQSFTNNPSPLNQHSFLIVPPSPLAQQLSSAEATRPSANEFDALPAPPNRRTLGLSTGSNLSTASSGLGSFPFQIESEVSVELPPPATLNGRRRASLDTLALTNDLSSYPLSYDQAGLKK